MKLGLKVTLLAYTAAAILAGGRALAAADAAPQKAKLLEVQRIWDAGPHNAFTDLIRFKDRWYCTFREGQTHDTFDGKLRVLCSEDALRWESVAWLAAKGQDLRDPKLCILPDGRLMLNTFARRKTAGGKNAGRSLAYFSADGHGWGKSHVIGDPGVWLWSATRHRGFCYSFGYHTAQPRFIRLYRSPDGRKWETLANDVFTKSFPNESSLVFSEDQTCFCLLKCSAGKRPGHVGSAKPPYVKWTWRDLKTMMSGGPKMIRLPDGRFVAAAKLWEGRKRLGLCWLDTAKAELEEFLTLPAAGGDWYGDFSYPGMVWHENLLWLSYYSGHEGKTSIYLAKVQIPPKASK